MLASQYRRAQVRMSIQRFHRAQSTHLVRNSPELGVCSLHVGLWQDSCLSILSRFNMSPRAQTDTMPFFTSLSSQAMMQAFLQLTKENMDLNEEVLQLRAAVLMYREV